MSTIGTPARTSSPSWTSAMLLPFQIVFTTAMPAIGAWMDMRSALPAAWRSALAARSRRICRMRMSASAARRFSS